jgi:SAM-dependent methyltransferase
MSGFSPAWLALREPADRRARNADVLAAVASRFEDCERIGVTDLGCGTGSTLRALAGRLPARQSWRLVDHDAALLDAARAALAGWADGAEPAGDGLNLVKDGRRIAVTFARADLLADIEDVLASSGDLVTASALFDLTSEPWIGDFVHFLGQFGKPLYAALTYDGRETWQPPHRLDAAVREAFHAHQRRDKGFGPAAGPAAAGTLIGALRARGYAVTTGDSPWRLGENDAALLRDLAQGTALAVRETGLLPAAAVDDWLAARRQAVSCVIGHTDVLAIPASRPA